MLLILLGMIPVAYSQLCPQSPPTSQGCYQDSEGWKSNTAKTVTNLVLTKSSTNVYSLQDCGTGDDIWGDRVTGNVVEAWVTVEGVLPSLGPGLVRAPVNDYWRILRSWGGSCTNGNLISEGLREQDNHCGSCDSGYALEGVQCPPIRDCVAGEGVVSPLTATHNRVCAVCVSGTYSDEINIACKAVTPCSANHYQTKAPTTTSDRECTEWSTCPAGQGVLTPGSDTADITCEVCSAVDKKYSMVDDRSACADHQLCPEGQYSDRSSTSNSHCIPCPAGTFSAGQNYDTSCTAWRGACASTEDEAVAPSLTQNRLCVDKCVISPVGFEGCHTCGAGWAKNTGKTVTNLLLQKIGNVYSLYPSACGTTTWGDTVTGNVVEKWEEGDQVDTELQRVLVTDEFGTYHRIVEFTAASCTALDTVHCSGSVEGTAGVYTGALKNDASLLCSGVTCSANDREVCCEYNQQPVITITGGNENHGMSTTAVYTDGGATCADPEDGDITSSVEVSGSVVNYRRIGKYYVHYDCKDSENQAAVRKTRVVTIVRDALPRGTDAEEKEKVKGKRFTGFNSMSVAEQAKATEKIEKIFAAQKKTDEYMEKSRPEDNGVLNLNARPADGGHTAQDKISLADLKDVILAVDDGFQLKYTLTEEVNGVSITRSRTVIGRTAKKTSTEAKSEKIVRSEAAEQIEIPITVDPDSSESDVVCFAIAGMDTCCTITSNGVKNGLDAPCTFEESSSGRRLSHGTCDYDTRPSGSTEEHCCFDGALLSYDSGTGTYTFSGDFDTSKFCAVAEIVETPTDIPDTYSISICDANKLSSTGATSMSDWTQNTVCNYCTAAETGCVYCAAGFGRESVSAENCVVCAEPTPFNDAFDSSTCGVNDCDPNPCLNGGTCTDQGSSFYCVCAQGWSGSTCNSYLDGCNYHSYGDGTTCTPCPHPIGFTTMSGSTHIGSCMHCDTFSKYYQENGCCTNSGHPFCTSSSTCSTHC